MPFTQKLHYSVWRHCFHVIWSTHYCDWG